MEDRHIILIDKNGLLSDIAKKRDAGFPANQNLSSYAYSCVLHAPAVDAEPIRRGAWICDHTDIVCSVCGASYRDEIIQMGPILRCPSCGAILDLSAAFPGMKSEI